MVWLVNTKFLTGSIAFEKSPEMKQRLFDLLSLSGSPDNTHDRLESSHGGADRASITPTEYNGYTRSRGRLHIPAQSDG